MRFPTLTFAALALFHASAALTAPMIWGGGPRAMAKAGAAAPVVNGGTFAPFPGPEKLSGHTYTENKAATYVIFTVEWSDDFTTWSTAGVTSQVLSDNGVTQQTKATLPAGVNGRRFVHLKMSRP